MGCAAPKPACLALALSLGVGLAPVESSGCHPVAPCLSDPASAASECPPAACPRDATQGPNGRCECTPGDLAVLGACVPPAVGDAYCGRAGRMDVDGCAFRSCAQGELLDLANGSCIRDTAVPHVSPCPENTSFVVESGSAAFVPSEAACPRGATRNGRLCARAPRCPPGTLAEGKEGKSCRPIVTLSTRGQRTVDVGAWAALVLGPDGGPGTPELCRPLVQHFETLGMARGESLALRIGISLAIPDQDITRVHAETKVVRGRMAPRRRRCVRRCGRRRRVARHTRRERGSARRGARGRARIG